MEKNEKIVKRSIFVADEIWRKAKSKAALEGKPTYEWVVEAIIEKLNGRPAN